MTIRRLLLIIFTFLSLLIFGLALDLTGFLGNLIAGAIEVLLTVTILNWLIQIRQGRRWARTRGQLMSAISYHLATIAHEFMASLEGDAIEELERY